MHTKKGREIFNAIKDDFSYVEIAPEAAVAGAKEMKESVAPNEKRESFFKDANRMSGEELFNKYFPETFMQEVMEYARCKEVSADKLVAGVKEMFESVPMNLNRTVFLADATKLSGKELFEKYYPVTKKVKVKTAIRKVLLVTGIYGTMKKCLNRVRGR